MSTLGEIQRGSQIHPDINPRDTRFKIRDRIKKTKSGWKGVKISAKNMGNFYIKYLSMLLIS